MKSDLRKIRLSFIETLLVFRCRNELVTTQIKRFYTCSCENHLIFVKMCSIQTSDAWSGSLEGYTDAQKFLFQHTMPVAKTKIATFNLNFVVTLSARKRKVQSEFCFKYSL